MKKSSYTASVIILVFLVISGIGLGLSINHHNQNIKNNQIMNTSNRSENILSNSSATSASQSINDMTTLPTVTNSYNPTNVSNITLQSSSPTTGNAPQSIQNTMNSSSNYPIY